MSAHAFRVDGIPTPQGSTRAFVNKKTGRVIVTADNPKTKPWRADIVAIAREFGPFTGPIQLGATFYFPRPQGHYGTGRNQDRLKPGAPRDHLTKPDLDKLLRALCDALKSAGVYKDDSHVVGFLNPYKRYCDQLDEVITHRPGVEVVILEGNDNP